MKTQIKLDVGGLISGLLGVLFVALKLTGVIAWSWWWVTLPFWGPAALMVAIIVIAVIALIIIKANN